MPTCSFLSWNAIWLRLEGLQLASFQQSPYSVDQALFRWPTIYGDWESSHFHPLSSLFHYRSIIDRNINHQSKTSCIVIKCQYLCLIPWMWHKGLNTGSVGFWSTWGSSCVGAKTSRCPLGPFAWTLYCQKNLSRRVPLVLPALLSVSLNSDSAFYVKRYETFNIIFFIAPIRLIREYKLNKRSTFIAWIWIAQLIRVKAFIHRQGESTSRTQYIS